MCFTISSFCGGLIKSINQSIKTKIKITLKIFRGLHDSTERLKSDAFSVLDTSKTIKDSYITCCMQVESSVFFLYEPIFCNHVKNVLINYVKSRY